VPGHEVVGVTEDGRRVVINPVLACVTRGLSPLCPACAAGRPNHCERLTGGSLPAGLQVGYCAGTGGGWSGSLVAHESSLIDVPTGLSDEAAVLVEPVASAIHGALAAPDLGRRGPGSGTRKPIEAQVVLDQTAEMSTGAETTAVVIGAGMQGLATIAALTRFRPDVTTIIAVAKHPEQRRLATELGASVVAEPGEIRRAVRRRCGGWMLDSGQLTGGAPLVIDCVGSPSSLADALAVTAPGGTIVLTGMPGQTTVDLTPLWQREITLRGAYTYGTEHPAAGVHDHPNPHSFELAFDLVGHAGLERLLSATYPLDHYADAIGHAANAGRRGAVKVAFDLRGEKKR
jgi:threonine dehydrogenase-like Zn-dependent dehydrogenase